MTYQPAVTIAATLQRIHRNELVLPGIQREYVWSRAKVEALFDSLMRGYPLGSFLSWKLSTEGAREFRFYEFLKRYSEYDSRHNAELPHMSGHEITAVLDGQQRLTSLYIGALGSFADRKFRGRARDPQAYPVRRLHLRVDAYREENESGIRYDFLFLTDQGVRERIERGEHWVLVKNVFDCEDRATLRSFTRRQAWADNDGALDMVDQLWDALRHDQPLNFFEETEQDLERVLDIFVRVNSGGERLTQGDLLLSIATAQWRNRDARAEIYSLVDLLNAIGDGFSFNKDLILKASLVLADIPNIEVRVRNFNAENMALIEGQWDAIANSLRTATALLMDFGLSGAHLTATSALIPIANYVHVRRLDELYRGRASESHDRQTLKNWVLRSLVVPRFWSGGVDTLLRDIRSTLREHGRLGFPADALESILARRGRTLALSGDQIEELLEQRIESRGAFSLLAILFPQVNTRNRHHVDHVFPYIRLTDSAVRASGIPNDEIAEYTGRRDRLANLQLLEEGDNVAKSDKISESWASAAFPDPADYHANLARHRLPPLPKDVHDFIEFYERRRTMLADLIRLRLGASAGDFLPDPSGNTSDQ